MLSWFWSERQGCWEHGCRRQGVGSWIESPCCWSTWCKEKSGPWGAQLSGSCPDLSHALALGYCVKHVGWQRVEVDNCCFLGNLWDIHLCLAVQEGHVLWHKPKSSQNKERSPLMLYNEIDACLAYLDSLSMDGAEVAVNCLCSAH